MTKIKIFKKITAISLALLLTLSFTSCSKDKDKDKNNKSSINQSSSSKVESKKDEILNPPTSSENTSSEQIEDTIVAAQPIQGQELDLSNIHDFENVKKGWGQGKNVDKDNRPTSCNEYQTKYGEHDALFIMPKDKKTMYLTFDEGYENGYTTKILDALKEKDCKAVFFVTLPYVEQNPDLIKRMIDEGHTVGNHSVHHKSLPTLKPVEIISEITELHNYMVENYNYQMTLFRPPMGEWSTQTLVITKKLGYKTVFWSYAYLDYDVNNQMGVEKAFPKVTGAAHNGAIYLLHAVSKDNAQMMGDLIDNFKENGYKIELLK